MRSMEMPTRIVWTGEKKAPILRKSKIKMDSSFESQKTPTALSKSKKVPASSSTGRERQSALSASEYLSKIMVLYTLTNVYLKVF